MQASTPGDRVFSVAFTEIVYSFGCKGMPRSSTTNWIVAKLLQTKFFFAYRTDEMSIV